MTPYRPALIAAALAIMLTACDPIAAVYVRQPLRPAPAATCIANALGTSPLVSRMSTTTPPSGYDVEIRDSSVANGRRRATVEVNTVGDSGTVSVVFRLPGKMTWGVDAETSRHLGQLASAVTETVREACASDSPSKGVCRVSGMWWTKSCGAAG